MNRWLVFCARLWLTVWYRLVNRRYNRLTVEYVHNVPLLVLPRVFNPVLLRTGQFMVERLSQPPFDQLAGQRVLDLGTGSGVGAVFAARQGAKVVAVDINPQAVRCAQLNLLLHQLTGQVDLCQSDLVAGLTGRPFDLILFNPPFYRGQPQDDLDYAWRGVDLFERFVADLPVMLTPNGRVWLVLSSDGDGQQLLTLLTQRHFRIQVLQQRNLINELLTLYQVTRNDIY